LKNLKVRFGNFAARLRNTRDCLASLAVDMHRIRPDGHLAAPTTAQQRDNPLKILVDQPGPNWALGNGRSYAQKTAEIARFWL
jgi:hypothetical protein